MESSGSPSMSGATIYLSSSTTSGDGGAGAANVDAGCEKYGRPIGEVESRDRV